MSSMYFFNLYLVEKNKRENHNNWQRFKLQYLLRLFWKIIDCDVRALNMHHALSYIWQITHCFSSIAPGSLYIDIHIYLCYQIVSREPAIRDSITYKNNRLQPIVLTAAPSSTLGYQLSLSPSTILKKLVIHRWKLGNTRFAQSNNGGKSDKYNN